MVAQIVGPPSTGRSLRYIFSRDVDAIIEIGLHRWYPETDVTILGVVSSAGVAPVGAGLEWDLLLDQFEIVPGGSLYTTTANRPKIADGAFEGVAVAPDVAVVEVGHYVNVQTLSIGSTTPGSKIDVGILYRTGS